jgi:Zn-dependent protease with chaperone function
VKKLLIASVAFITSCAGLKSMMSSASRGDLRGVQNASRQMEQEQAARREKERTCNKLKEQPVTWEEEREIGGAVAVVLGSKTKGPYTELSADVAGKPLDGLANRDVTPPTGERASLNEYVNKVGKALAANSERPDIRWTFMVLDDPSVNAFSAPGGYVFVTTGLLKAVENEAQLAGVLGHEIGHVTGRHALEGYKLQKAQMCTSALVAEDAERAARESGVASGVNQLQREFGRFGGDFTRALNLPVFDVSNLSAEFIKKLTELIVSGLTKVGNGADAESARKNEFAADEAAARYMSFAGYDPAEYEKLIGKLADGGGIFQPHPSNKDRIAALAKARADDTFGGVKAAPAFTTELQAVKK